MTDGPHDHHDHEDYTAHPSRPHTYQFRINEHQQSSSSSSKLHDDDDRGSVHSFDRSGEILPNCVGFNRPLNQHEQERIAHLDRLKFFLATAPSRWDANASSDTDSAAMMTTPSDAADPTMPPGHPSSSHPALNRFLLPTSEYVSCVLWNGLYHITGTDIVRALVFRFEAFGRPVRNMKKFEEGIFSDLRNLKPGVDACLEEPKVSGAPLRSFISASLKFARSLPS
jgi:transcription factor STE12